MGRDYQSSGVNCPEIHTTSAPSLSNSRPVLWGEYETGHTGAERHGCLMADERAYIADLMLDVLLNEIGREDTKTLAKERLAQLG